ncbi:transmembrane and immunoglobulin domain-containing protein 2 [Panthera onca]
MTELARARDWEGACLGSGGDLEPILRPLLQGTAGLSVQQGPKLPQVREDSQVTLARQVVQSQAWGQQLRVGGKKDGVFLCDSHVTKGRFSLGVCGPRWQLSWESRGNLNLRGPRDPQRQQGPHGLGDRGDSEGGTLRLSCLSPPSSNVTPASSSLQLASPPRNGFWNSFSAARRDQLQCSSSADRLLPNANHTSSHPGAVAVAVAMAAGAGTQVTAQVAGRTAGGFRRRPCPRVAEAGTAATWRGRGGRPTCPFWKERVASGGEGAGHPHGGPDGSIRSLSRRPPDPQPRLAQKPCPSPSPGPPISTVGVSPDPRPSGQQKPRGLLEEGSEPRKDTPPPPPVAT